MKILYKRTLDSLTMKSLQDENNKQKWKRRLQQSFPTILNVFHTKKVTSIYAKNRQQRTCKAKKPRLTHKVSESGPRPFRERFPQAAASGPSRPPPPTDTSDR